MKKKEHFWRLFCLLCIILRQVWQGMKFSWSAYPVFRTLACLVSGFLLIPATRLAWNAGCPGRTIGNPGAALAAAIEIGLAALLTKTRLGNQILDTISALTILCGCIFWLLAAALPALAIYALAHLLKTNCPGKSAYKLYFGPLEWADRSFFLARRTGN